VIAAGAVPSDERATTPETKFAMFGGFPQPQYMPCEECGASVARAGAGEHMCERERWLDYQVHRHRGEIEAFEDELAGYLATPEGRFEAWDAERRRGEPS
jgi:hypothetical protein